MRMRSIARRLCACLASGALAHSVPVAAAGQANECNGPLAASGPRILVISGEVEQPQLQVERLGRALSRQGLGPVGIDLQVLDESDPSRIAAQLDPGALGNRRAIVTLSGHIARALTARDLRSPVIFATILDPLYWGIVDDYGPRRVNASGVAYSVDLEWKYLEHLRIAFPQVRRAGVLADRYFFERPVVREILGQSAARLGITVVPAVAETREELERVFASASASGVDAWIVPETPVVFRHEARVLELVGRRRIPNIFGHRSMLRKGAIMTFGVEFPDMWEEIAQMARLLCAGVEAREIPIVRPHRVFLGMSATNARAFGLSVDPRIYRLATFWH